MHVAFQLPACAYKRLHVRTPIYFPCLRVRLPKSSVGSIGVAGLGLKWLQI